MTNPFQSIVRSSVRGFVLVLLMLFIASCEKPKEEKKQQEQVKKDTVQVTPPVVEKRINVRVIYPEVGQARPNVDSNFIFGSVGVGYADLKINGYVVPVAPSGGFLAFLPMPPNGVYEFQVQIGTEFDTFTHSYAPPSLPSPGSSSAVPPTLQRFAGPQRATVITGSDTLQTGSDVAGATPSINADRKWFFPRGAVLKATGRQGNQVQVALSDNVTAWVPDTSLRVDSSYTSTTTGARTAGTPSFNAYPGFTDVRVSSGFAPFLIEQSDRQITLTLYGLKTPSKAIGGNTIDTMIADVNWSSTSADGSRLTILLQQPLWGFKVFYDRDGAVVLRVRRPPVIDMNSPLSGRRILVDAGHPPAGATGPTGLKESEANLAIALPLAQKLRAKGATVIMTRTTPQAPRSMTNSAIDLWARAEMAVNNDAEILLSVHNNAFPDGVNPFTNVGTSTYYYHAHARDLARALQNSLLKVTNLPDKLANQRSLAVVRPTWMPATLTESLYMMFPDQEMMLRDPQFTERLAQAHVEGLEAFLLDRAQQALMPRVEK